MRRTLYLAAALVSAALTGHSVAHAENLTYCDQALEVRDAGNHDLAVTFFTRCLDEGDLTTLNRVITYNNRGVAYRKIGEFGKAIADYEQALRLDPGYAKAHNNLGIVNRAKGEVDLSIQDYDRAISFDPGYADAYFNRGNAYVDRREYDRAIDDFGQAIRLDPSDATAHVNRGNSYFRKRDYDSAIQDYELALRLDPGHAGAINNREMAYKAKGETAPPILGAADAFILQGNDYFQQGQYDRAIQSYDQALGLDDGYAIAYFNRGNAYSFKGEIERAIRDYDQVIRIDPGHVNAHANRGHAYTDKGDYAQAIRNYDQAINLDPGNSQNHLRRGRAHFYRNDMARAADDLQWAVTQVPDDAYAVIWLYLAEVRAGYPGAQANLRWRAKAFDLAAWPGPVVRMFLGELAPQAVAEVGRADRTRAERELRAEAYFYLGQQQLLAGQRDRARQSFEAVLATGITNFFEYQGAKAEMRRW
ncbi:MAG: tetratricopeptide repeat protein [Alphaproteobacteria bacterium]|nr:tetratricopeptide repeat protein [Alphaproteobacteria bacterium]